MDSDELITVEFVDDFQPFDKHKGETRKVSQSAAYKLYHNYKVIKNPFNNGEKYKDRITTVVVIKPSMLHIYGPEWYPNSEHDVDPMMVRKYIDDGSLQLKSNIRQPLPSSTDKPVPPNISYRVLDRLPHMNHVHLPGETHNWYPESPIVRQWENEGKIIPLEIADGEK